MTLTERLELVLKKEKIAYTKDCEAYVMSDEPFNDGSTLYALADDGLEYAYIGENMLLAKDEDDDEYDVIVIRREAGEMWEVENG